MSKLKFRRKTRAGWKLQLIENGEIGEAGASGGWRLNRSLGARDQA